MDLHYSQTLSATYAMTLCLNPLWIYTTLKQKYNECHDYGSLNPLWIYTTLKLNACYNRHGCRLNPLWIYTTLKQMERMN